MEETGDGLDDLGAGEAVVMPSWGAAVREGALQDPCCGDKCKAVGRSTTDETCATRPDSVSPFKLMKVCSIALSPVLWKMWEAVPLALLRLPPEMSEATGMLQ